MKNIKKFMALVLAVLLTATLCIPALAAETSDEECTCEDPWLENPEYDVYSEAWDECCEECHTMASYTQYDCSRCGRPCFVPESFYQEAHDWVAQWYESPVNGVYTVRVDECSVCGMQRRVDIPLD